MPKRRINFITGQLAAPALNTLLGDMTPPFDYQVVALPAHVAALMKTEYIARKLPAGLEGEIIIPGGCKGEMAPIHQAAKSKVIRGPVDMMDLPAFFGGKTHKPKYGQPRMKILAEIVDAPLLSIRQILKRARDYSANGADWIDIGCMNNTPFPHLAQVARELCKAGYNVSVDSADPEELMTASRAGARMFLSVNSANLSVAEKLEGKVVVIPDPGKGLANMFFNAEKLSKRGVDVVMDPILDPLIMGTANSIFRYIQLRRRMPQAQILMGAGNLTELVTADNVGLNTMIAGVCAELKIDYLLTTEVAPWNRGAVAQLALARSIMEYAVDNRRLPKGYDNSLLVASGPKVRSLSARQIGQMKKMVTDRNFRIFVAEGKIHIFNKDVYLKTESAEEAQGRLGELDPAHAFYLGMELMKAQTALSLGKPYIQDEPLSWGYITAGRKRKSKHQ